MGQGGGGGAFLMPSIAYSYSTGGGPCVQRVQCSQKSQAVSLPFQLRRAVYRLDCILSWYGPTIVIH